jgi:hypothetical protein
MVAQKSSSSASAAELPEGGATAPNSKVGQREKAITDAIASRLVKDLSTMNHFSFLP